MLLAYGINQLLMSKYELPRLPLFYLPIRCRRAVGTRAGRGVLAGAACGIGAAGNRHALGLIDDLRLQSRHALGAP